MTARTTPRRRMTRRIKFGRIAIYALVLVITAIMVLPFVWMLSASLKLDREVFAFPIAWIPPQPRWQNYVEIWQKIPLATFVYNTAKIAIIVTILQLFTSSFAAYAFA
jgi:multiple sugar transport system permease protein